jgi:hypothetical protein
VLYAAAVFAGDGMASEIVKLLLAAVVGTLSLLALADNPWDGDELIKGPIAGLLSYCGGSYKGIYDKIKDL